MYFSAGKMHRSFAPPPQRRQKAAAAGGPGSLRMTSERGEVSLITTAQRSGFEEQLQASVNAK